MKEILITNGSNPQPEVRKNAETASDWEYRAEALFFYGLAVLFRDELIDPILRLDRSQVPDPVISFDNLRQSRTLAGYTLNRNPQGLLHEITFNTTHYDTVDGKKEWRFGRWSQSETLLHEQLHLKQQKYGKEPYKGGRVTHNKEFVGMGKDLGLNIFPVVGYHYAVANEGSPFARIMHQLGIQRPDDVPTLSPGEKPKGNYFEVGRKRKGRSSLTKYSCGCQNAWIGASEFAARCERCGNEFIQATVLRETLKNLANITPPEILPPQEPEDGGYDVDVAVDRFREAEEERMQRWADEWEDLSYWMERNFD